MTRLATVAALVLTAAPAGLGGGHARAVRVAVVTARGNRGALARDGLAAARKRLGVEGRTFVSRSPADHLRVLSAAARQGYDLVVADTPAMAGALAVAARRYPQTKFAIVAVPWSSMTARPGNVLGLVFAAEEAGYLAGAAAALASKTHTVSAVGELRLPASVAFLAGFKAGAQRTVAGTRVQLGAARAPAGAPVCREIAFQQIEAGSDGVAAATPACALGALQAAGGRGVWGIGLGTDQSFRGRHILTSVIERADVAVYETVEDLVGGRFRGGADALFTIGNGGITVAGISPRAPATLSARLTSIAAAIGAGKVELSGR